LFKRIAIGAALGGVAAYASARLKRGSEGSSEDGSGDGSEKSFFGRITGAVRGGGSKVADAGQAVGSGASGLAQKAGEGVSGAAQKAGQSASGIADKLPGRSSDDGEGGDEGVDDVTLARKVETEIFRDPEAPKGSVDVNVQEGVVQLRGEVERQELMDELVGRAREVQGVQDVENLLHLPGDPAPMHQ
jgi:osmotically-inducible protein OsmY